MSKVLFSRITIDNFLDVILQIFQKSYLAKFLSRMKNFLPERLIEMRSVEPDISSTGCGGKSS